MITRQQLHYKLAKSSLRKPMTWLRHRRLRTADIFIASYPRAGSTWLRFLLFELLMGYPATFETINREDSAVPEVKYCQHAPALLPDNGRLIKTHEPYRAEYRKAIYLARDVRDVAVSEYNYLKLIDVFTGSLDEFINVFIKGEVNGYGNWNNHFLSWYEDETLERDNLLIVRYEDLLDQGVAVLKKILHFLQVQRNNNDIVAALDHNNFELMKMKEKAAKRTMLKHHRNEFDFVRRGLANQWPNILTNEQTYRIEECASESMSLLGYPKTNEKK